LVADLTPTERRRLVHAIDVADAAWQQFWAAQRAGAERSYRGEERPLNSLTDEAWEREYAELAKTGEASCLLGEALAGLARVGVPVPSAVRLAVQSGRLDIMLQTTPAAGRPEQAEILKAIQSHEEAGRAWFRATLAAIAPPPPRPRWDRANRELWYGNTLCARYKRPAPNQHLLLQAFEELGWPERIDDPLPRGRRADTISDLQATLKAHHSAIVIERDGSGTGFTWRSAPNAASLTPVIPG
jgi:hypothetical protein